MGKTVLVGAALIAVSILAGHLLAPLVAPYRFQAALLGGFWRFNIVTGEAMLCLGDNAGRIDCGAPQLPGNETGNLPRPPPSWPALPGQK
jgi:hypothetical protein